jgi:hypothetical protein
MKNAAKGKNRVWKAFNVNRNRLDEELNQFSNEGREIHSLYESSNVTGTVVVVTYRDE